MFKPIPLNVLIHECVLKPYLGRDDWGGGDMFGSDVILKNVRIEYNKNYRVSANAEDNIYKAMLFYDITNSNPTISFVAKSKVIFNDEEMTVESVNPVYSDKLHHYELGMI